MKFALILIVALMVVGGYYYYTKTSVSGPSMPETMEESPGTPEESSEKIVPPSPGSSSAASESTAMQPKVIDVEAGSYYYKPNTITVKAGQPVEIVMHSVSLMHDFVIDELNVKMPIVQNGNTGTVEFTPTNPGTYEYYCSVGDHRAKGMVGTLTVTP